MCGTVFIDRSNIKEAQAKINNVAQTLVPDKVKLWVFPEGTRNSDKKISLLPFKKGAFHVAQSCNLPILPIGISLFKYILIDDGHETFSFINANATELNSSGSHIVHSYCSPKYHSLINPF